MKVWLSTVLVCFTSFWVISSTSLSSSSSDSAPTSVPIGGLDQDCDIRETKSCAQPTFSPYQIIVDGGSTGSRLHVYYYNATLTGADIASSSNHDNDNARENGNGKPPAPSMVRLGSARAWSPLSAYGPTSSKVFSPAETAEHLLEAFQYAIDTIPPKYHSTTPVKYAATAGMRLLSEQDQERVYTTLYEGLTKHDQFKLENKFVVWPFHSMAPDDIFTLSGSREGFYGMIAANYLAGRIHTNLVYKEEDASAGEQSPVENAMDEVCGWDGSSESQVCQQRGKGVKTSDKDDSSPFFFLGALDMGGSSTQIVYHAAASAADQDVDADATLPQLQEHDFFATSYLSYGVDQFRNRLWDLWVHDAEAEAGSGAADSETHSGEIKNPCFFPGYVMEYKNYSFVGTGDSEECTRQIHRLIPSLDHQASDGSSPSSELGRTVGGIAHPPLPRGGRFYAMSLYYFSLDCLRELAHPHENDAVQKQMLQSMWPSPSLNQLRNALEGFCGRSWTDDLASLETPHKFTRSDVLPHRCFEATYMTTLLLDGFGFDPHSRDITFTFDVEGQEVEWTLGMALSMLSDIPSVPDSVQLALRQEEETYNMMNHTTGRESNGHQASADGLFNTYYTSLVDEIRMAYFLDMFGYHHTL